MDVVCSGIPKDRIQHVIRNQARTERRVPIGLFSKHIRVTMPSCRVPLGPHSTQA